MGKEPPLWQESADTRQREPGGRRDGRHVHEQLIRELKQESLREQRRAHIREEVVRLRAGGTPPPRPLCPHPAPDRWGARIARARAHCPRLAVDGVFWAGGLAVTVVVWATRGAVVSLVIPLTAVAFTARHRFFTCASADRPRGENARRRRPERLANR
ncbi:hypothetical protein [Streptomyces sp. NPDC059063]|uniref:hypothetical protein n=1 Tax=unclassified Streptomyces TaxID=2593676 RepID=UPI00367EDD00